MAWRPGEPKKNAKGGWVGFWGEVTVRKRHSRLSFFQGPVKNENGGPFIRKGGDGRWGEGNATLGTKYKDISCLPCSLFGILYIFYLLFNIILRKIII